MSFFFLNYLDPHVYQHLEDRALLEKCSGPWPPEEFVGCDHIEVDQAPVIALYRPILKEVLEEAGYHVRGLCLICLREQMLMERRQIACSVCSCRGALSRHWVISLEVTQAKVVVVCENCYPKESFQGLLWEERQAKVARRDVVRERFRERVSRARAQILH